MSECVDVIFRKFPDGDVIALFPAIVSGTYQHEILSYMHHGQHGTADARIIHSTKLAPTEEFLPLLKELEGLGYLCAIKKRMTKAHLNDRRATVRAQWDAAQRMAAA